ncbi:hypothetical protein ABZP36_025346 [Zizania latifolia]
MDCSCPDRRGALVGFARGRFAPSLLAAAAEGVPVAPFLVHIYVGWDNSRAHALALVQLMQLSFFRSFLYPKRLIYLYFFITIPAAIVARSSLFLFQNFLLSMRLLVSIFLTFQGAVLIGADLWMVKKGQSRVSGSARLGGALVAALAWTRIRKGWI